jgi:hypothetical protein
MRLLAVVLLVGTIMAGCGGSSSQAPGATAAPPESVSGSCVTAMKGLTDALFALNSRLSVGMNYAAYGQAVGDAKVAYDKIKIPDLDAACLSGVGKPAEAALNEYLAAYTVWNNCIGTSGCTNDSIKSKLQDHWATASTLLAPVKKLLP